jgi:hypothetical protein
MKLADYISIAATMLFSLGSGGVIVFSLSNWLGKVWADRLMQNERQKHAEDLENLRNKLKLNTEKEVASVKHELEIAKEKYLADHTDRIAIYRSAIDLIAIIVAKIEMILIKKREPLTAEELHEFEVQRLRIYAYLAMHAPQSVMDANDTLTSLILSVVYDGKSTSWEHFRKLAIILLNEIRKDIGVNSNPIEYRGER